MSWSNQHWSQAVIENRDREFFPGGMTRAKLLAIACELRHRLLSAGGPSRPALLVAENKEVVAAALLSTLFGGPPLVIPYASSPQVLNEVLAAVDVSTAVVDAPRELPQRLAAVSACDFGAADREMNPEPSPADRPILWLFTGGSTGHPKMWRKTAANIFMEANWHRCRHKVGPEDVIVSTVPPFHIYGLLFSVALPLVSGARVVADCPYYPKEIVATIRELSATILVSSPAHYQAISAHSLEKLPLRSAFSSGGFLDPGAAHYFSERAGTGIVEVYGSTETGGVAYRCRAQGEEAWTPVADVRIQIDEDERLHVASSFLSPDLPLSPQGFFATGDRATEAADGKFHLLGRVDGVVKVGGKRVELEDVRHKILQLPGVSAAVVFSLPGSRERGNQIVALVVTDREETALRRLIAEALEPAARPKRLRVVDVLPLTPMGKLDLERAKQMLSVNRESGPIE